MLALVAAVAVVVVIVVANDGNSNHSAAAGTTATGAVTVQRRNLVATDTESGTLSYANPQTVYNRLSGTITWVPKVGQIIRAGRALFDVDNKPVLLMSGSTPAYRDLQASDDTGPDIYELNRNLVALGYNPDGIVVDDTWQAATTAGIDELQYHLGETETGTLALGQVVFLPGPQMIQTVDTTVGSTGGGSAASYKPAAGSSGSEFVDFSKDGSTDTTSTSDTDTNAGETTTNDTTTTTGTETTPITTTGGTGTTTTPTSSTTPNSSTTPSTSTDNLSKQTLEQLIQLVKEQQRELQAEQRASKSPSSSTGKTSAGKPPSSGSSPSSAKPSSSSGNSGTGNTGNADTGTGDTGGGSAVAVLSTSSTKLVVTVDLSPSSQSEASIGEKVTVEMPNGGTQSGRVTAVSPVAQSSDSGDEGGGSSGSSSVPVTVELDRPARGGGLDQAAVSVDFVQHKADDVLSVPVTALLATSGSSFAVQEAASPHRLIAVRTGLFAAGYVEISGRGIHPGLEVTDSQG